MFKNIALSHVSKRRCWVELEQKDLDTNMSLGWEVLMLPLTTRMKNVRECFIIVLRVSAVLQTLQIIYSLSIQRTGYITCIPK